MLAEDGYRGERERSEGRVKNIEEGNRGRRMEDEDGVKRNEEACWIRDEEKNREK